MQNNLATEYFENGTIKTIGFQKNGIKYGSFYEFFENGKLHKTYTYIDGKKNGEYLEYYSNGALYLKGKYNEIFY